MYCSTRMDVFSTKRGRMHNEITFWVCEQNWSDLYSLISSCNENNNQDCTNR